MVTPQDLNEMKVCILCGGNGTRLWPLSRKDKPKQFIESGESKRTLFEEALIRGSRLTSQPLCLVCNENQLFLVNESVKKCGSDCQIIAEPVCRDTTAAILSAIIVLSENGKKDINVLVLPSDLLIKGDISSKLDLANDLASQGHYITFGIKPNRPETGFGYLKVRATENNGIFAVDKFTEKPNIQLASQFIADGNYYWNSGIFLINSRMFLEDIKRLKAQLYQNVLKALNSCEQTFSNPLIRLDRTVYMDCESVSIDFSLMEHVKNILMLPLECQWSDMGSWESVYLEGQKDQDGNVKNGDVITLRTENSYLYSPYRLLATVGIENLTIVDTRDAVLVANRQDTQGVKELVKILGSKSRGELDHSIDVKRQWGCFQVLLKAERFQVKKLKVLPGKSLSLQIHHHRAEHWVVVKGSAEIVKNKAKFFLTENESIYIPVGCKHQLRNPGKITLEVIEIQTGSYLEEDDIVRLSTYSSVP